MLQYAFVVAVLGVMGTNLTTTFQYVKGSSNPIFFFVQALSLELSVFLALRTGVMCLLQLIKNLLNSICIHLFHFCVKSIDKLVTKIFQIFFFQKKRLETIYSL